TEREPTDQLMDFWQGPTADLPVADDNYWVQRSDLRTARPSTHATAKIFAMPTVSYLWTRRIHVQRTQHDPKGIARSADGRQKRQWGCPPLMGVEDGSPSHLFRHHPPNLTGIAPHRRCSIRYLKLPDTIVGKGNGAYPPTTLDCGTTNHRHPRFGPAT
ncbi:helicase-like protein, partial [Trypanosoma cruzi]